MVVRLPVGLPAAEEERLIAGLVGKVTGASRVRGRGSDTALERRAARLADRYLDGIRPTSVSWSSRMRRRHGSCTPAEGTIRISRELATAPSYVLDHVLLHELVHLVVPGHGPDFHELLDRDPNAARAAGWLEGYTAGRLAAGTDVVGEDHASEGDDDPVDDGAID